VNLAWNTNNLSAGILSIVSAPTPSPQITSAVMIGGNFIFSATNGVPNWLCYSLGDQSFVTGKLVGNHCDQPV